MWRYNSYVKWLQKSAGNNLISLKHKILELIHQNNPDFLNAIFNCSIPRWFNQEIVAGMCSQSNFPKLTVDEIFQKLQSFPFSKPHSSRELTWIFYPDFRVYLTSFKKVTDEHLLELHRQAAATFKHMLDAKALKGAERFQDPDWREIATEWVYHLLNLDPVEGLKLVWQICAEAFAVPTFSNRWEVNFCLEFLNGLEWRPDSQQIDESINFLKTGFGYLAAYQDTKALDMSKRLAEVPGITPEEKAELHYWIGGVHLYKEGRYAPALEEQKKALKELDSAKHNISDEARLKEIGIKEANIYDVMTDVYLTNPNYPNPSYARCDLALEYAEKAKNLAPDKAIGYVALGKIYAQQEDWDRAEEQYQKAKEVEPNATDAYLRLSEVFEARRDVESVIKILDELTKIDPSYYYDVLIRKGNAYFSARQFKDTVNLYQQANQFSVHQFKDIEKIYQQAEKEAPDRIDAYIALGNLYSTLGSMYWDVGQSAKAEKFYQKAIDKAPDVTDGYVALASMYEYQEKWKDAIKTCQEGLDKDVNNKKQLYLVLSGVYRKQSRFEDMKKIQEKIISDDLMEEYAAHCAEGNAYLLEAWNLRNQPEQAQFLGDAKYKFDKALEIDDKRAWTYLSLAELAVLLEDESEVQRLEQLVSQKVPWARYDLLVYLGQAYYRNFQGVKSEALLKQAIEVTPHRTNAWRALSDLYIWQCNLAGIEEVWLELVSIDKTLEYEGHITVGNIYHRVANLRKAREEYIKARDLEPETADAYLYLAMLDKDEGNWNDAVRNYLHAAEIASDFASFSYAQIAEIYLEQEYYVDAAELAKAAILFDAKQIDGYLKLAYLGISQDNKKLVQKVSERLKSIAPNKICEFYCALSDYYRLKRGEYEKAEQVCRDCIKCSSKKADSYISLGITLLEQNQYREASKELNKALKINSTNAEAYAALGRLYLVQGDLQRGIENCNKAVKLEPNDKYNASLEIGAAYAINFRKNKILAKQSVFKRIIQNLIETLLRHNYRTNQDFYLATQQYREAINFSPWRVDAYMELASLFVEQDQLEEADKIYRQAKESTGYIYSDFGAYYLQQQKFNEAFRVYHLGIRENPSELDSYLGLIALLVIQEKIDEAFQVCHDISPELRYEAYISLGSILSSYQIFDGAEAAYRQGIKFEAKRPEAYIGVAQLLVNRDRLDKAFKVCEQMLQQPELRYNANVLRGSLLIVQEREDEAEQAYQQAIKVDPNQLDAYSQLAALYEKQQRINEAIQLCKRAVEFQSTNIDVTFSLYLYIGELLTQQEHYSEVVEVLQRAVQLNPDNLEAKISLAKAYFSWGEDYERQLDVDRALENYKYAIENYSKYSDAYIAQAKLYGIKGDENSLESMTQQILELNPAEEYNASLVVANAYQVAGNSEKEEGIYRQLIEKYPKQPKAFIWLAQLLAEQQQLDKSIQSYQTAAQLLFEDAEVSDAYKNIGNLYIQQERYSEALEAFQKAVKHNQSNAEAYLALGRIFKQKGNDEELEQLIQSILALDPEDKYGAYLVSAAIYKETQKNEQAEATYQQAIQEYPKLPDAYTNLIELLVNQDRFEQAIEVCQEMAKQLDLAYNAKIICGNVLRIQENYHEAEKVYESAIEQDEKRPEAYLQLADLYQQQNQLNQLEKAQQYLNKGLANIPNNPDLYWMLAQLYYQQQQWDKAINSYKDAAEHQPDPIVASTAYEWIGYLLIQQGNLLIQKKAFDNAIKKLQHAIKELQRARIYNPYNAGAHFRLGIAYENLDQLDEALKMYTRAIQIDPEYFSAYVSLCRIYGQKGDVPGINRMAHQIKNLIKKLQLDKNEQYQAHLVIARSYIYVQLYEWAIKYFEEAVKIDPNLPDAYTGLGYIYLENNLEEAEKAFRQAISHASKNLDITPSANLFLADIYRKQGRNEEMLDACANVVSVVSSAESPDFKALRQQGLAHFMAGEYEEAAQSLNRALEANPQDAQARFYLALNLFCLGHYEPAQDELRQGIDLAPYKSFYKYAIEEAEILADQVPEVPGAQEMLQQLIEARDNAE